MGLFYATNPSGASWTGCDSSSDDTADDEMRWGSQHHYCDWQCIGCSTDRTVTTLDLGAAGLSGSLPALLGAIPSLERLNVSGAACHSSLSASRPGSIC